MKKQDQSTNQKSSRRRYDAEFKLRALELVASGRKVSEVARSLGINGNLLRKWKDRNSLPAGDVESLGELDRLRRQVKQLESERDILKKALSIFSRTP